MTTTIDPKYYALPDPCVAYQMTYWRQGANGLLAAWPSGVRYGPRLFKTDIPANLGGQERTDWVRMWHDRNFTPWWLAIYHAIEAGPAECAARFAALTARCCVCGRTLTDSASKVYGVGPECRRDAPTQVLAWLAEATGRAHAQKLAASGVPA